MKVHLISCNPVRAPYPVYPLGMSVVAAALERAGHTVSQYDMLMHDFSLSKLKEAVLAAGPSLVGISFRNLDNVNACNEASYLDPLAELVQAVHECSSAPVVLGGPGFSVMPERVLEASGAEYGVVGEGEKRIVELVESLSKGEPLSQRIFYAGASLKAGDMLPASYNDTILAYYHKAGGVTPLQTKRGCPYRCAYCTYPLLEGSSFRPRVIDEVIDEILLLQEKGAKQIFFTDSIFNDSAGHYRKLVDRMNQRHVCIPWTGFFRPENIPRPVIEAMKSTGLNAVELGSDATSDTTLKGMGKAFSFEKVLEAHNIFRQAGVTVSHYFMMGGPDETQETVKEGIQNVLQLKGAASFIFLGIRILPGTPLEERALRDGILPQGADLLRPVYYFSPMVGKEWLHQTLIDAFKEHRHVVYPPDSMDAGLTFLHQLGYSGMAVDLLLKRSDRRVSATSNES